MQRPASCEFLCGPLTSQQAVGSLRGALQENVEKHAEVLYYRKDGEFQFIFANLVFYHFEYLAERKTILKLKFIIVLPIGTYKLDFCGKIRYTSLF